MSRRRKPALPAAPVTATIESLSHDGRGVAHVQGKTVFIDGTLPGEQIIFRYQSRHRRYDEGDLVEVVTASPDRVEPGCAHFTRCGGCSLQHMNSAAQIEMKQQTLLNNLERIGKVLPEAVQPPLTGPVWGYRRKARLGVRFVAKKGGVLVGFREKRRSFITDIDHCPVLHPAVGERITVLRELLAGMAVFDRIPQIEVAAGDAVTALVIRHLAELGADDREKLAGFGEQYNLHIYLQPGNAESVHPLWPDESVLHYRLVNHSLDMQFRPTDFTQVNAGINGPMIERALELLAPDETDRVLDLFCGIGNFSLPIARAAASVTGVEGEPGLVQRARDNAVRNGIANVDFLVADLAGDNPGATFAGQSYNKVLLDPPRSGARELLPVLANLDAGRIVYVSCNPATLARDAGELVDDHGYRLRSAGVMDMFPHTAHVEAIALFER